MFQNPDVSRHFIQMWQHLKRALEEFAQIKLKSMFMPRGCRVLHLKIRRPSALRLSLLLWRRPARTTATIISEIYQCLQQTFFARKICQLTSFTPLIGWRLVAWIRDCEKFHYKFILFHKLLFNLGARHFSRRFPVSVRWGHSDPLEGLVGRRSVPAARHKIPLISRMDNFQLTQIGKIP